MISKILPWRKGWLGLRLEFGSRGQEKRRLGTKNTGQKPVEIQKEIPDSIECLQFYTVWNLLYVHLRDIEMASFYSIRSIPSMAGKMSSLLSG